MGADKLQRINETFLGFTEANAETDESSDKDSDDTEKKGMLIMDATAAPQDISYPTDVGLLNESREKLEKIIDVLWVPQPGGDKTQDIQASSPLSKSVLCPCLFPISVSTAFPISTRSDDVKSFRNIFSACFVASGQFI